MRVLFAERGFPRLFAALTTSMFGDSIMLLVLSIWVKTLTGSNAQAGFTFFFMVIPALGAPLLGVWVDRLARKPILVCGNLLSAGAVLPLVLVRDAGDVWIIWSVAFAYGVSMIVLPAALNGLLKDLLPPTVLLDANAALQTTKEGFRLFGPLVGAALFAAVGGWLVAGLDALTFVVAAVLVSGIHVEEQPAEPSTDGFRDEVLGGLRFVASDRILRHTLIGFGMVVLVIGFFETSIYSLLDAFHRPATYAGVFVTVQGVGAVAGGLSASRLVRRFGEVGSAVLALVTMVVGTLVCATAHSMSVVLAGAAVLGLSLPVTFVALTTLIQVRSPREVIGRVSAAVEVLISTPQAVSLAVGSLLVGLLDYRTIFWTIAIVVLLGAVYIAVSLRHAIRGHVPVAPPPAARRAPTADRPKF